MRLSRITVKSLFGVFNHDVPLNKDSGITIIIGENGLGKTRILEAVSALFDKRYDFFRALDFEEFSLVFDNGDIWKLTKNLKSENCVLFISRDSLLKPVQKPKLHKIYQENDNYRRAMRLSEREMMHRRMAEMEWELDFHDVSQNDLELYSKHLDLRKEYEYRKLVEKNFRRKLFLEQNSEPGIDFPKWFIDGIEHIKVKLIETQRIITAKEIGSDSYVNSLSRCSEELKKMISRAGNNSTLVASELDSSYPNRLVKKLRQGSLDSFDDLKKALVKLDNRRKLFSSAGLAVKISDSDLLKIDDKQKDLINVLKLYIDDSHKKLDPYEEISSKIILFKSIINKRFKHKKLEIKQGEGLVFRSTVVKNTDGSYETIPAAKLSSGEQNELILFFKLIFNSQKNDVILIDEPELSLHISWQNKFIKDLREVTSLNDVSIVIATHSPDIIDENWDLKVELLGIE